MKLKSL